MILFADVMKDSPGVGDVHVSSTGAPAKPKKPTMFNGAIAQSTKLPVTGATAAALIEDPDDAAPQVGKLDGQRSLKPLDDDTAHSPFPHDANALGSLRQDQVPRFFGALTNPGALEDKTVRLGGLTAMQNRVDPAKVDALRAKPGAGGKPVVVRANGRNYIADGHHRLSAAWLNGDNTAEVKFKDLTPHDNALKRFEPPAPEWSVPFTVAKADAAQQLIFGWASVVEKDGRLIIDKQGDAILPEDLEKAAYDFVLNARQHGEMHKTIGTGRMVESIVFTKEKQAALGVDLGKVGWWIGFKVDDADTWASHARGELPEFSIGGSGRREDL